MYPGLDKSYWRRAAIIPIIVVTAISMTNNTVEEPPSTLRSLTAHPAFQLASMAVGIVGVALAVFFYVHSRKEREPWYYVQPTRNSIVDRGLAVGEKLTILYDANPLLAQRVTAMQVQFWNAGREPIRASDVLVPPLRLQLPENSEILDVTVLKQSRPGIVNFRAVPSKVNHSGASNSADLTFDILEKDDGATLQVLYAGGPDVPVAIVGAIVEADIKRLVRPLEFSGRKKEADSPLSIIKVGLITYTFFPLAMMWATRELIQRAPKIADGRKESPLDLFKSRRT